LGLGTRPKVWYFFVFSLFLLGWGIIGQQCGISLFLVYLTKNKEIPHCWPSSSSQ
jgi:hypothetical protein